MWQNYEVMSEFWKRTLSGAVYVAVIVFSIVYSKAVFCGISAALAFSAVREYNSLTHPRCAMDFLSELSAVLCVIPCTVGFAYGMPWKSWFLLTLLLPIGILIAELWNKNENPIQQWGHFLIGQLMIALPFALMNVLCHIDPYLLLAVFVLIWVNDSGAYCVGVLTAKKMKGGNHKMFPRVSPNKSWEGLIGGAVVALAAGCLLSHLGWFNALPALWGCSFVSPVIFSLIVVIFGTLGDLMESLLKRTIGVKDSGKFMPGHGGVLDRFDSILLATPAIIFFLRLLML